MTDGVNRFKFPDGFVANKSRDEINKGLAEAFLSPGPDMIAIPYTPIVVNTGSKLVVIDTGTGEANFERSKGSAGQFHEQPESLGHRPQPDRHRHHLALPRRPHQRPADGRQQAGLPERRDPGAGGGVEILHGRRRDGQADQRPHERRVRRTCAACSTRSAARSTQYEADKEVAPGIKSVATYGHTPGHSSFIVASGNDKVFVQSDVTNLPLFVRNPGWHLMFDQDANMAEATRRKVYDMLAADKMMVQAFHYPFPARAYIEKTATGYRETMVPWSPTL